MNTSGERGWILNADFVCDSTKSTFRRCVNSAIYQTPRETSAETWPATNEGPSPYGAGETYISIKATFHPFLPHAGQGKPGIGDEMYG